MAAFLGQAGFLLLVTTVILVVLFTVLLVIDAFSRHDVGGMIDAIGHAATVTGVLSVCVLFGAVLAALAGA